MSEYISNGESALSIRNKLNDSLIAPAEFSYSGNVVSITAPENAKHIEFVATVDYNASYTYNLNGYSITLKNYFNPNNSIYWGNGSVVQMVYDNGVWYVLSSIQKATEEETIAMKNDEKFVTPKNLVYPVLPIINCGWTKIQEYTTAGSYQWTAPDLFKGKSYIIGVLVIGGGGSGAAAVIPPSYHSSYGVLGGASGFFKSFVINVSPNTIHNCVIGRGGVGKSGYREAGENGGSSSFDSITVNGGGGGLENAVDSSSRNAVYVLGGQCSFYNDNLFGGTIRLGMNGRDAVKSFCFNPFENKEILGAGGGAVFNEEKVFKGGKDPITNKGGGNGIVSKTTSPIQGKDATSPGCGGGAVLIINDNNEVQKKSGAGADGAVYIYALGKMVN